jgi:hypothetical protein
MNYPYPSFFLDVQLAKKRLAKALATGPGVPGDDLFPGSDLAEINEQRAERIQFSSQDRGMLAEPAEPAEPAAISHLRRST